MYKQDLALNNLQGFDIPTKPNQTKPNKNHSLSSSVFLTLIISGSLSL